MSRALQRELDRVLVLQAAAQLSTDDRKRRQMLGAQDARTPELAAWTMVANVLLNMDETISKE